MSARFASSRKQVLAPSGQTIVACATPVARAAIAVLRLSGAESLSIAQALCPGGPAWVPRRAQLRSAVGDAGLIDTMLVLWMPGPGTYTGEDVVELSAHGNPVIIEHLLDQLVELGARMARPGEFTRQALCNGRLDLLAAESLAGLIDAQSIDGVRIAQAGMSGKLSAEIDGLKDGALECAAELEARLDHPDEDLGELQDDALAEKLRALAWASDQQAGSWRSGRMALEGARVSLEGRVNVGKSSLFNRLVGSERALVSSQAGTTRDVVERACSLQGLQITWMDTAGHRLQPGPIEAAGIALGEKLTAEGDLHLVLLPLHLSPSESDLAVLERTVDLPRIIIGTHSDLPPHPDAPVMDISVNNLSGEGLDALQAAIVAVLGEAQSTGGTAVLTSQRQHGLLIAAARHLRDAATALLGPWGPAVAAEEVVRALVSLTDINSTDAREQVLDRLFSRFCIGK